MLKKIFLCLGITILIVMGIILFNDIRNNGENGNIVQNETQVSGEYVKDDCLNEWGDYAVTIQEELKETSQGIEDENKHYILKQKDGNICVYYINEKNEEILYKVTDISTEYLSKQDVESLEEGIDVYGIQNLNQLIEDFE